MLRSAIIYLLSLLLQLVVSASSVSGSENLSSTEARHLSCLAEWLRSYELHIPVFQKLFCYGNNYKWSEKKFLLFWRGFVYKEWSNKSSTSENKPECILLWYFPSALELLGMRSKVDRHVDDLVHVHNLNWKLSLI